MKLRIENSPRGKRGSRRQSPVPKSGIRKELSARIYADEDPVAGLRRAWTAAVALAEDFHEGSLRGTSKEVHFLRLTVKRLRSYLQLARAELDPEDFRAENHFLRDTSRSLAVSRDLAMALRTIERLERVARGKGERRALRKLGRLLEEGEASAGAGVVVSVPEATARALARLQESVGRFDLVRCRESGWDFLESGLERVYARAQTRFSRWKKSEDDETAHRCRRFAKYLFFHLELLETKDAEKVRLMRAGLDRLQRKLGRLNDLAMLEERLGTMAGEGLAGRKTERRVRRLIGRASKQVTRACREAGAAVFRGPELPAGLVSGVKRAVEAEKGPGKPAAPDVEFRPG